MLYFNKMLKTTPGFRYKAPPALLALEGDAFTLSLYCRCWLRKCYLQLSLKMGPNLIFTSVVPSTERHRTGARQTFVESEEG